MNIGDQVFVYRKKPENESHFVKAINQVQPEPGIVSFMNFDGSVNVGGFSADGSPFALTGLKPPGNLNPPTLPYYTTTPPAAAKPVVTTGVAQPLATQHATKDSQSTNKAVGALPVVTR
jgi:hypothetical protein